MPTQLELGEVQAKCSPHPDSSRKGHLCKTKKAAGRVIALLLFGSLGS